MTSISQSLNDWDNILSIASLIVLDALYVGRITEMIGRLYFYKETFNF